MAEKRVIEQVASNEVHNDDWFLKDSPTQDTSKISATNLKAILGADGTLALEEIANAIAEEYDSTHTYYNTELVFHEGVLYQCTATSVTGTWDSTKWNVVDIKDLLDNVSTNIGYLWNIISNTIAGNYDTSSTYNTGDYAIYSIKLYRCKDDDVTGAWNSSKWEEVNIPEYIDYVLVNAGKVDDVKVDGTSVVTNKVAEIEIPVKDVQIKTDSTYDSVVDASGNAKIDLSSVTAYGEVPNLPQPIATFKDGADAPIKSLKVTIEPQQDLHGYDSPWAGGARKNKLQNMATTQTISGVTYTVNADGTISLSGTASGSYSQIIISRVTLPAGTYKISDALPLNVNYELYIADVSGASTKYDKDKEFTITEEALNKTIFFYITGGQNVNGLTLKPMIRLASITDSTFAPYSNICPITGYTEANVTRTGKNLFDGQVNITGGYYDNNGTLVNSQTTGHTDLQLAMSNTYYTFTPYFTVTTGIATAARYGAYFWNSNGEFISRTTSTFSEAPHSTFMTPNNCKYISFQLPIGDNVSALGFDMDKTQLELGSTATAYEPYAGTTYTIDLDGTRYGGELDVVSGVLTLTHGFADLSELTAIYNSGWNCWTIQSSVLPNAKIIDNNNTPTTAITDRFKAVKASGYTTAHESGTIAHNTSGIWFIDNGSTTELSGQLVYELATPLTIQLTPTQVKSLLGSNNVWADTGDINECVYRRDMSSTIDDIIARLEALEG